MLDQSCCALWWGHFKQRLRWGCHLMHPWSLWLQMGGREGVMARESTHLTLQTRGRRGIRCILRQRALELPGASQAAE